MPSGSFPVPEPGAAGAPRPDPRGRLAALIGLPAAGALLATIAAWEGYEPEPYVDLAGVPTICWGDTQDVRMGRAASRAECEARLERQALAHLGPVLACVPQLRGREGPLIAAGSLAYNIGTRAFCRSTAARHFRAGDWRGGCDALTAWNKARVNGRLVPVRGLTRRRRHEREICLRGLDTSPPRQGDSS
ncbi:lysozyme [Sphingosinicella terrae]|uniref:lysozyme n=1 Tax=Sphingosinicella terrae TaxID=2172047 RepID=UPI000E0D2784|nr:lysozyme [Sphingosinicella terrae]